MPVCNPCKAFNIKNGEGGIGYGFSEHRFRIWLKGFIYFLIGSIFINIDTLYAEFFQRKGEQIDRTAVYFGGADKTVVRIADIQNGKQGCRLSRSGTHSTYTTLQLCNFIFNRHNGRVAEP